MTHNYRHPLLAGLTGVGRVHQDAGLPVQDQAPVLHCSAAEVRYGDHVVLGEGVGDVEELRVEGERLDGTLQGKPSLLLLTEWRVDPDIDTLRRLVLNVVELPDHHRHQVGAHHGAGGELHYVAPRVLGVLGALYLRHVGQHHPVHGGHNHHVEGGFHSGFVPTGKGLPESKDEIAEIFSV